MVRHVLFAEHHSHFGGAKLLRLLNSHFHHPADFMATNLERLVVQLSADIKRYENALNRARGVTNRQARQIETRFKKMNSAINAQFVGIGRGMAGAFAGVASARAAQDLLDSATRIENALKVAGLAGEDLTRVYDKLFESAQRNAVPLESMVVLYGRIAQAQDALNVSQEEMTNFTDKVGVALRVAGTSAQEASGALLQLSQALGAGIVRAEEYNSINEGARPILQAVAAGLREAGGDVAKLRNLVMEGKVSSEAFFRAFEAGSVILEQKVAGAELTVSQSLIRLQNVLIDAAKRFDEGSGASRRLADALQSLSEYIAKVNFEPATNSLLDFIGQVGWGIEKLGELKQWINDAARAFSEWTGGSNLGDALRDAGLPMTRGDTEGRAQQEIESRINQAHAADRKSGRIGTVGAGGADSNKPVVPVSLADYPIAGGGGSGGSSSTRARADEYERLSKRIAESTANIIAETEALRGLDPLVDDYGYTLEKARAEQELMNAALSAGKEITPELKAQISALAEQYALATVEAAKLAESQDLIRARAEDMRDFQKDLTRGIVDGFIQGKNAADIFSDALSKLGNKLLDLAFDAAFGGGNSGSPFGFLGSLFGGFAEGGYTGRGGKHEPKGIVHGGEYVFSKKAVQRAGVANLEAMHRSLKGYSDGGLVTPAALSSLQVPSAPRQQTSQQIVVNFEPVIDNRGASVEAVARTDQQLRKLKEELPAIIMKTVRDRPNKRW